MIFEKKRPKEKTFCDFNPTFDASFLVSRVEENVLTFLITV